MSKKARRRPSWKKQYLHGSYADIIRDLREMQGTILAETEEQFREFIQETILSKAADAIEALLAERDTVRKELIDESKRLDRERIARKEQQEETAALLKQVESERDALLARLAPVEDKALINIAADKMRECGALAFVPAAIVLAIRPHIEAAERERCAKAVEKVAERINVAPHERPEWEDGYLQGVHDAAAAIRSGK